MPARARGRARARARAGTGTTCPTAARGDPAEFEHSQRARLCGGGAGRRRLRLAGRRRCGRGQGRERGPDVVLDSGDLRKRLHHRVCRHFPEQPRRRVPHRI